MARISCGTVAGIFWETVTRISWETVAGISWEPIEISWETVAGISFGRVALLSLESWNILRSRGWIIL